MSVELENIIISIGSDSKNKHISFKKAKWLIEKIPENIINQYNSNDDKCMNVWSLASYKDPGLLPVLYSKGLDLNFYSSKSFNIIMILLSQENFDRDGKVEENIKASLDFFIKKGVDVNCLDSMNNNILISLSKNNDYHDFYKKYILNGKLDINHKNINGDTPLMYAVNNNSESILFLLEMGADPYIENEHGENAFDIAKMYAPPAYEKLKIFVENMELNHRFKIDASSVIKKKKSIL